MEVYMASVVDAFNEALSEDFSYVKFIVYAIPVYVVARFFMIGKMGHLIFWGFIAIFILLGVLTQGINNVRRNKKEILTSNPLLLIKSGFLSLIVLLPQIFLYKYIGNILITKVPIPDNITHLPLIYSIIVWSILFSVLLTSYLSFAKYLKVKQAFNLKVILESCVDVLLNIIFFIPQLALVNLVIVGPIAYAFSLLNISLTNMGFIAYCSIAFVINVSIIANYFAQVAFDCIKGNNEDYDENVQISSVIDTTIEKIQ
jgi:hypothetical protein